MSSWRQPFAVFAPSLPAHCAPESQFLTQFSSTFHTCVPTELAFISTLLGTLSIVSWLFAQMPQIYKNYSIKSTSGLSIYFLVEWCLGDVSNLLGAVFTGQASWQVIVAGYYCFVDFMLVAQWVWYERLKHGNRIRLVWPSRRKSRDMPGGDAMQQVVIEGRAPHGSGQQDDNDNDDGTHEDGKKSAAKNIHGRAPPQAWRMPGFAATADDEKPPASPGSSSESSGGRTVYRTQPSSSFPYSPSPRTVLFLACLLSVARASPISAQTGAALTTRTTTTTTASQTDLEYAGTLLSWLSTALYLGSRVPQLYKNYARRSTSGLSAHLFVAAFFGNLFYSTSLLTNPLLYESTETPYGLGGWAGPAGNDAGAWMASALPFWLGAAGVLGLDGAMGVQFLVYGDRGDDAAVVVVRERERGRWRWRRVSGWMRGWVPSFNEPTAAGGQERSGLLAGEQRRGYGAVRD
ncbi:hypothetical protein MBLNU459_g8170t1 [Dothideomycetes sp. NU459]